MYITRTCLNINEHKASCTDSFKGHSSFQPPPLSFVSHTHTHLRSSAPSSSPLHLTSVRQSGVRGFSLQSVLSCCFVESGGLWGVSTGDRCERTSSHRRCTGMVSLRSGSGGVGTARRTGKICLGGNPECNLGNVLIITKDHLLVWITSYTIKKTLQSRLSWNSQTASCVRCFIFTW